MKTAMMILLMGMTLAAEQPKDGKKKIVQQTPFGVSVRDAAPAERPPRRLDPSLVKVEEKGDSITFRRLTPFGEQVWTRKRADLTVLEKELLAEKKKGSRE